MKKALLVIFFLLLNLQLSAYWCMPRSDKLNVKDPKTGQLLPVYWNRHDCKEDVYKARFKQYQNFEIPEENAKYDNYQSGTDEEIANFCKANPERDGCFKRNKDRQLFCEDYEKHHKKSLDGGTCQK